MGTNVSFQFRNESAAADKVKELKGLRGDVRRYVAQAIPQINPRGIGFAFHGAGAEIAKKGHFWMETSYPARHGFRAAATSSSRFTLQLFGASCSRSGSSPASFTMAFKASIN